MDSSPGTYMRDFTFSCMIVVGVTLFIMGVSIFSQQNMKLLKSSSFFVW